MLSSENLYKLAKCRFDEAKILLDNDKLDGAIYLCGYAIELMLKRRIALLLDWDGYPESNSEFEGKQSFKIHKLDTLLHLSGLEKKLKSDDILFAHWQVAGAWDSEIRYQEIGKMSQEEAQDIINSSKEVLNFILREKNL